jgi:LmbE family N-acetylglucosaminyl deacetylase
MEPVDVLAIGAHIGDCEIACGMALAAHVRQGKRVAMLHLTTGEKGHPTMPPQEYAAQKREEARQSAAIYGAEVFVFDYGDGELPVSDEVKFRICDVIRECRPRLVIGHWHGSMHKDHTNAALNLPDAIFYAAIRGFERKLPAHGVGPTYYAENWEDRDGFVPEVHLAVTPDDMALWERAARAHALFRGGVSRFPYIEYYKALARVRGCEVGLDHAVAFATPPSSRRRKVTVL